MKYIFLSIIVIVSFGCSSLKPISSEDIKTFNIDVTSYGSPINDTIKSYYLKLNEKIGGSVDDLINSDYIRSVEKVLENKNYVRIKDTTSKGYKYLIEVSWSISDPQKSNITVPEPVLGLQNIPISSPITTNTTSTITQGFPNSINVNTKSVTQPNLNIPVMGVTGYVPSQVEITRFNRNLQLICKQNNKELWIVNTESIGSSNDLRYVLKLMSFVISDYIEFNSEKKIQVSIKENKPELLEFINSLKNN
jgi:hypothetical protein